MIGEGVIGGAVTGGGTGKDVVTGVGSTFGDNISVSGGSVVTDGVTKLGS